METEAETELTPSGQPLDSSSISDPEPIATADFKGKLLSGLGNRYGMIHTLLDGVGRDNRVFIYLHQDSDTFFTLQSSSILFERPELDGFDGYPSDYDNDLEWRNNHRVYWRLCDKSGNNFAAPKSEPYSKSATWITPRSMVETFSCRSAG